MINLKNLIDFLPPIFKNTDTYKVGGKGILERFLEICGEYLEDDITPDIENTLDLIDLDKTDTLYLNYLWELLGEIPFANSPIIDKTKWDMYHNGTLSNDELNRISNDWVIPKGGLISLDDTRVRDLLKYTLTLLKIRGTKKFFETLFRIYGIECTINDNGSSNEGLYAKLTSTDSGSNLDNITTDTHQQCDECLTIGIDVSTYYHYSDNHGLILMGSDEVFFMGTLRYTSVDTKVGVDLYNQYDLDSIPVDKVDELKGFIEFRRAIEQLLDKYLPCNVTPRITYSGVLPNDRTQVNVQYLTDQHITNENPVVKIRVLVTSTYSRSGNKFYMSKDPSNWGSKTFDSGHVFEIEDEGDFYFKSVDTPSSLDYITVVKYVAPDPSYRLVVTSTEEGRYGYNSTNTPVYWVFSNSPNPTSIKVLMALVKGNRIIRDLDVKVYINGKNPQPIYDDFEDLYIQLPVGDTRVSWVDNPEVYIDIKVISVVNENKPTETKPKYKGIPYGVSGSFNQLEYYKDENGIVRKVDTYLGSFGTYGAIGTSDNPKGNVVTLSCTRDDAYGMKAMVTNLQPWAYQYNELSRTVQPIEGLTKVDILYCNETVNYPYFERWVDEAKDQVVNNLQGPDIFYKATTISVKPTDSIDLLQYIPEQRFGIKGGILLLHPNTEELISKGLLPNDGSGSYFYPNFLVVVIPPIDLSDEHLYEHTQFTRKYQESVNRSTTNTPGRVIYSPYRRNDMRPDTDNPEYSPLIYDRLEVNESYYSQNELSQIEVKQYGVSRPTIDYTTYLGLTKVLVFNNKGYSSLDNRYFADSIPSEDNGNYPIFLDTGYMRLDGFHWSYLETINLIYIDIWAPFMNTQCMVKRYNLSEVPDGLYIKPILTPEIERDLTTLIKDQFMEAHPEFPWDYLSLFMTFISGDSTRGLLRVNETKVTSNFRLISVNTVHNIGNNYKLDSTIITPIIFQFVVYRGGIEWDQEYYLIDEHGVKYLPNCNYEIANLGGSYFKVVPNVEKVSVPPIPDSDYTPSFYEVKIDNGKLPDGTYTTVKSELKLTKARCIINSTKPDRSILVGFRNIYPVLGSNSVNLSLYQVVLDGSTDTIVSKDLVEPPLNISEPGTYKFILGDDRTGTYVSDIIELEIVDPYNDVL